MEHMWKDEILRNGIKKASLQNVVWKFIRTRVILDVFLYLISLSFGFLGPVSAKQISIFIRSRPFDHKLYSLLPANVMLVLYYVLLFIV